MNAAHRLAARLSEPARMRYAGDVFRTGHGRLRDRLVSTAYFAVSTPAWGNSAVDDGHLAPFRAALDVLAGQAPSPRLVVDVGTGAGGSAAIAAERWPGARVEGIDSSWRMLRHARRLHRRPNLRFRHGSALSMPYDDASIDVVTCLNAIVVPSEMRRVGAEGAQVLLGATWVALRDDDSDWVRRFAEAGFRRIASDNLGTGSWEIYRLEA